MKKSKFVKAIAAFTMSAVATAGCISLVACGGHTHNTNKGWQGHNDSQHWYICDDDGVAYGHKDHVWGDDDVCDECNYDRNPNHGGSGDDGPSGPGGEQSDDADYDAFIDEGNVIYQNKFDTDATVDCIGTGEEAPATGIYGTVSGNPVDFTEQNVVSISGGKLNVTDNSDQTTNAYVKVDAVNYKKVHIYGKVTPTLAKVAGKWSFVRVLGEGNKDLIDVRANGDKKIQLYDGTAGTFHGTPVDYASDTEYKVEITLDLVEGTASLKFGGTVIAENQAITGLKGSSFTGVMFITAGSDSRSLAVDNLAIKTAEPETAALKEALDAELDAYYAKLTATEGTYTDDNKALLDDKYAAGVAAIAGAQTNETVVSAYEAAVADLDGVETIADAALNVYKEEKKTELENSYTASDYIINKEQFDTTLAAEKAKIDAATSTEKVDEALAAAKTALNAVKTDAQQIAADKQDAENQLVAYKGGAVNYSFEGVTGYENKAAYTTAITDGTLAIEAATTQEGIATALANAQSAINEIKDNAAILAEAQAAANTQIDEYKAEDIAELSAEVQASAAAAKDACKTAITNATTPTAVFNAVNSSKTTIDGIVNAVKMTLEQYKTQQKADLQTYAEGEIAKLDSIADATLIAAINQAVTDGNTAIDAVAEGETANATVLEKFNEAKAAIDKLVADDHLAKYKAEKITALTTYATAEKEEIHNNAAYSVKIDEAVTAGETAINAAEVTDTAAVDAAYTEATNAIDGLVTECKASEVTVTLEGSGLEALKVTFGTAPVQPAETPTAEGKKFKGWYANVECTEEYTWETVLYDDVTVYAGWILPDVTVSLNVDGVDGAEWQSLKAYNTDSPADLVLPTPYVSGKVFSKWHVGSESGAEWAEWAASNAWTADQTVTLYAEFTDKTDADLSLSESWIVQNQSYTNYDESTATGTAFEANSQITDDTLNLYVVSSEVDVVDSNLAGSNPSTTLSGQTEATKFTNGLRQVPGVTGTAEAPNKLGAYVITAKEDISLVAYLSLADKSYKGKRSGSIKYTVNNGAEQTGLDNITALGNLAKIETELKAGDVLRVYGYSTSSSEARLWLLGVEAEISETFTNATVVYHGYSDGDHSTPWLSIKPVTAPEENPSKAGGSFLGWSTTENNTEADYVFDENAKVAAGATLDLYPVYQTADVTINFYGEDKTTLIATKGAVSGNVFTDFPVAPEKTDYKFVGWYTVDGDAKYDFTQALATGTINVYAYFEEITANMQTVGFTNSQIDNTLITAINGQRTDDTKFIDNYNIISIIYDSDVANKKCGDVNSIGFGGQIGTNARHVTIDLTKYTGTATVTLGVTHSSGTGRKMFISESITKTLDETILSVATTKNELTTDTVELECGKKYYICADSTVFLAELTVELDVNALKEAA